MQTRQVKGLPRLSLPGQPTTFIGRLQTIDAIKSRLSEEGARLLTLTGTAGIGKTRLAMHIAAQLAESFAHEVYVIPLAPIADPSLVFVTIAQTLGIREAAGRPVFQDLTEWLRGRHVLLVLDNFEHLLASAPLVGELLDACPRLSALVTSRTVLRLAREQVFEVPPMQVPDPQAVANLEAIVQSEAVQLFVERARAVQADFALTTENARAVVEICRRLDGLPLAIELAAARVRVLAPESLLGRLSSRLALLTSGARDVPLRHQTLRDAIAWSYDLLRPVEQQLFERLAVFSGGVSLQAAEAVGNADGRLGIAALDLASALVDQSLIKSRPFDGRPAEPRLELLETIREYALERLAANGEELSTRERHAAYFLALAETAEPQLRGPRQMEWLATLQREHDNLRAALRWCVLHQDEERALRFGGALWRFWQMRGFVNEGRQFLTDILALADVHGSVGSHSKWRASALNGAGNLAWLQGDTVAAQSLFEHSLQIRRALDDRRGTASCLNNLGNVAFRRRNYAAARSLYEQSLGMMRQLKANTGIATVLNNLGDVASHVGDDAAARVLYEESLAIGRALGDRWSVWASFRGLGDVAQHQGDHQVVRSLYEQSLMATWELGGGGIAEALERLAGVAVTEGQPERALRLAGAAASRRGSVASPRSPAQDEELALRLEPAYLALSEEAARAAWMKGQVMSVEQAVLYALDSLKLAAGGEKEPGCLTRREHEVAALLARGRSNREIAQHLVIAPSTAERHVANILNKLALRSRTEIALWVVEHGLEVSRDRVG